MDFLSEYINSISVGVDAPFKSVFLFFTAGALSSLFPCYYPLIPITIGFLQKKSSNYNKIWIAPLFYWFGTLFVYFLLGIVATFTGIILSKIMQNSWFLLVLGVLFLYLGFAMLDFVNLEPRIFRQLEEKTKQKQGLFFVFVMGFVAGLAASACVSPALVSILLFVAQISSSLNPDLNNILFGILLTISYGAGLGLPFFLSGIVGAKLPRTGKWSNYIKYFFAITIFAIAFYQIFKAFRVFGIEDQIIYVFLILFLFLLLISYIIIIKFFNKIDLLKLKKIYVYFSLSIVLLISFIFVPVYGSKKITISEQTEIFNFNYGKYEYLAKIKIYRSVKEAIEEAKKQDKPIFIDFYADWCTNCVEFAFLMKSDPYLQSILSDGIVLKIYDTDPSFEYFFNQKGFEELQIGLPFFVILTPDFRIIYKTNYYKDFKNFEKFIKNYKQGASQ